MYTKEEILGFSDEQLKCLDLGEKSFNLIWACNHGFEDSIPSFVIIPWKEIESLQKNGIEKNSGHNLSLKKITKAVKNYFTQNKKGKLRNESPSKSLPRSLLYVRSSADIEDKKGIPAAGLFYSKGFVELCDLSSAINDCILYSKKQKIKQILGKLPKLNLIIQKMIFGKKSGVCFTKNPISDEKSEIIIESLYGMCEGVVSGKYPVDSYFLDKKNISQTINRNSDSPITFNNLKKNVKIKKHISLKKKFINSENGEEKVIKDKKKRNRAVLSNIELINLAYISLSIEKKINLPVDIEWTFDHDGKLWILQIRLAQ